MPNPIFIFLGLIKSKEIRVQICQFFCNERPVLKITTTKFYCPNQKPILAKPWAQWLYRAVGTLDGVPSSDQPVSFFSLKGNFN
jgi:hypothetical protein